MLHQASIAQVKNEEIPRNNSHIVIAMRFYPRFLKKELRDEFVCDLAPEKQLLKEFNDAQKQLNNHNAAFAHVDYNSRFSLNEKGMEHLKRLAHAGRFTNVYFACICAMGEMCHREILMLAAKHYFDSEIDQVFHSYPEFMDKL